MIDTLFLENFKAFGQSTQVDLAPITLFFGENSAGKSSILHSLNLLKQTQRAREAGVALLPRAEDAISDMGSFRELVFDHDCSRTVTLGIGQRVTNRRRGLRSFLLDEDSWVGMRQTFSQPEASADVRLTRMQLCWPDFEQPLATYETRPATKKETREFLRAMFYPMVRSRRSDPAPSKLQVAECVHVARSPTIWSPIFGEWKNHANEVVTALTEFRDRLRHEPQEQLEFPEERVLALEKIEGIHEAISFYEGDFTSADFVARMVDHLLSISLLVSGQTFFFPRRTRRLPELDLFGSRVGVASARAENLRLPCPNLAMVVMDVTGDVEGNLWSLFPMGPFRRPPERWYIFTGTSPEDVGYKGQLLPDLLFRRPELVVSANEWLERLDVGYALKVEPLGQATDLFEVRVMDTRRGRPVEVALSDVGYGVSQILPFVVQSLAAERQIISIEQPEVHIHPRLQADLGDLLAETIKAPYGHQFLIETHSEHLMLRLQRLIREGNLQQSDVSVVYVARGETGSVASRLRLDSDGDFVDEWPGGFFPERRREL
jgi:hypothetical protein